MTDRSLQVGNVYTHDTWDLYLGRHAQAHQRQPRHGDDGDQRVECRLRHHRSAHRPRARAPRVDASEPGRAAGSARHAGHHARRKIQRPRAIDGKHGMLRAIVALPGAFPLSSYTPDFAPLSIGTQSQRISPRLTLNYQSNPGWYLNASTSYTRRADVTLDRPYFFTDNEFMLSNQVAMPERRRLRRQRRLPEARPERQRLLLPADDAGRRRHPPSGHAVRVQPRELLEGGRDGDVSDSEDQRLAVQFALATSSTAGTSASRRRSPSDSSTRIHDRGRPIR